MSEIEANIRERTFVVEKKHDGLRLDQFISTVIPRLSRTRAGEIAKHGDIELIPARRVKASAKVRYGDQVVVREHLEPEELDDSRVEIAYEDDHILAVNKPPGMLVHEAAKVRLNTVHAFLKRAGFEDAEPAHRIDRETSGVLMCGKNKEATRRLQKMFAESHPIKTYRALVEDPDEFWAVGRRETIDTPLGLDANSKARVRMTVGNLHARTHAECISRHGPVADLKVNIETGRQHQIRVHLSMLGTPIAGDKLYIYDDDFFCAITEVPDDPELSSKLRYPTHALHAWRIEFAHPFSGSPLEIETGLPAYWSSLQADHAK